MNIKGRYGVLFLGISKGYFINTRLRFFSILLYYSPIVFLGSVENKFYIFILDTKYNYG